MSWSLIAFFLWALLANLLGALPSKDNHWRRAYFLIAIGLPILVWVFAETNIWIGLACLAAGLSVLRWPVIYLTRWLKRTLGKP